MTPNHQPSLYAARQIRAIGGEGILTEADLPKLAGARRRVFHLMRDGAWHNRNEIDREGGHEGMRRMRELREWFTVDIRRADNRLEFEYRLGAK